ncbi:tubulin binding cofactor C-domain-containing protein [Desarmillaria tabescens]|uniref:Tubulin binding cofactor C-domain-containing protein n=1 Tax=Armillaria tabescens TaxID=1929756 RepID=A0AA39NNX8_ARMTA|nr:tubulin binding cofactor C-domain-containing protein [Desarmillaria tabescens]KAK0469149.1 tubulin binding cofactor C-domain-containing protein [Desarmillaria tabescens]
MSSATTEQQWTFSQQFSSGFLKDRTGKISHPVYFATKGHSDLQNRISASKEASSISNEIVADLSARFTKLTKDLADAVGSLPAYDQKGYENQLKFIEAELEGLRKASKPVSRFSFKKKQAAFDQSRPLSAVAVVAEPISPEPSPSQASILNFSSRNNELLTVDLPDVSARDVTLSDLVNCVVNLISPTKLTISAVHAQNLRNVVILLPMIQSSIMLHDLDNCVVVVGCHQFRMHTSRTVDIYLSIPSHPVIENCSDIRFAGYPSALQREIQVAESKHTSVQDFSHIRASPSPNWTLLPEDRLPASWPLGSTTVGDFLSSLLPRSI